MSSHCSWCPAPAPSCQYIVSISTWFNQQLFVANFDARFTSKSPRESDANNSNAVNGRATSEDCHMFKDFDYISPEMSARLIDSTDEKEDPSATLLPDEMQELRIRGFGP